MPARNVLILMADQHNTKCLGCYGHPVVRTPHLDRLAARGVRLTSAYAQNPICTPSRMCYLTGQYVHNHGYYGLAGPTPHRLPNLFEQFHDHGYFTGAIGKIHLPADWIEPHCDLFAEAFGRTTGGLPPYPRWLAERSDIPAHNEQHVDGRPDPLPKDLDYDSGWALEMTRRFLEQRPSGQPFLLWLTLYRPHQEYSPAQEYWDLYPDPPLPPSADDEPAGKLPPMRRAVERQRRHPPARYEPGDYEALRLRKLRGYYGSISQMDWAVGQAVAMIDALGERENTVIVYGSDHGDFACEHGLLEKAPGISADAIGRVPMIWSLPGTLPEGAVRDALVETIDLWPTLARLCGLPGLEMWDGRDLTELLCAGAEVRDAAFTENPWSKCITTRRWRMTWVPAGMYPGDPVQGELYDRLDDPWERRNLYHLPAYQPVVRELTERLMAWLVTSAHPVTAWPVCPHPDLADRPRESSSGEAYPEDGRTAPARIRDALTGGQANYL